MTPMERIEGELSDAQKRIAELERRNVGLAKECQAQQEQITELKNALTRQARAAKQGMDAANKHGSHMESEAKRLHAECNPEALESEREANAKLTELVAELERERDAYRAAEEAQIALRQKADEREAALAAHVDRLNSKLGDIKDSLYGQNLHVAGWHLNGATEPVDAWFEENDWEPEPCGESALAHLKTLWQVEVLESLYHDCIGRGGNGMVRIGILLDRAIELKEEAEEINDLPA